MLHTLKNSAYVAALTASLVATGAAFNAHGSDQKAEAGNLVIENTFTFATPPGSRAAGGYLTVTNNGDTDDTLTGGSAIFSELTEIHEMKMVDDVMKMGQLEQGLTIPAGESVMLKPGGFHMMFMQLTQSLKEGETKSGTLIFSNAGEVAVQYEVVNRGEYMAAHPKGKSGSHHGMKHGGKHMKSDK